MEKKHTSYSLHHFRLCTLEKLILHNLEHVTIWSMLIFGFVHCLDPNGEQFHLGHATATALDPTHILILFPTLLVYKKYVHFVTDIRLQFPSVVTVG